MLKFNSTPEWTPHQAVRDESVARIEVSSLQTQRQLVWKGVALTDLHHAQARKSQPYYSNTRPRPVYYDLHNRYTGLARIWMFSDRKRSVYRIGSVSSLAVRARQASVTPFRLAVACAVVINLPRKTLRNKGMAIDLR
jgi:hypothetical protein